MYLRTWVDDRKYRNDDMEFGIMEKNWIGVCCQGKNLKSDRDFNNEFQRRKKEE